MLSDPKMAIIAMAVPLFIYYLVCELQLFIDSYWCSGLGAAPLAAQSLASPIYRMIVAVGAGLGVGASTAIARAFPGTENARTASAPRS